MDVILKIKLKRDLEERFSKLNYDKDRVSEEINTILQQKDISFTRNNYNHYRKRMDSKENQCIARIWNDKYGGQCSHKCVLGEYCRKHFMMLQTYNKLPFKTIREERPNTNQLTGESLHWYDMDSLEQLQIFCNIHSKKIIEGLIVKRN